MISKYIPIILLILVVIIGIVFMVKVQLNIIDKAEKGIPINAIANLDNSASSLQITWESLNLVMEDTVLISYTQRYKQLGNAVTVNVVKEIAKLI